MVLRGVEKRYAIAASTYDVAFRLLSLGCGPELHRLAAHELVVSTGDTVLDLGCGTGLLVPYLLDQVGQDGKVIAVDVSPGMIRKAQERVNTHQWRNVVLHCQDVRTFRADNLVQGVVFCLSLSTFPDCEAVLRRAVTFLQPGKRLVIVDAFLNQGKWYYPLANAYTRVKAVIVGSEVHNHLREVTAELLEDIRSVESCHGLYSVICGKRPR